MRIGIIGINHKQASLALREKIAKICSKRFADERVVHPKLSYVLLSTCNRTELYFHAPELPEAHAYLLEILKQGSDEDLGQKVYSFFGIHCFRHLARVTAGLDSAILGESEIQGQVKIAYQEAMEQRFLPSELHFLFQKVLKIGKEIRTNHRLRQGMVSLEETLYQFADQHLGPLQNKKILFLGVSRINQTILAWFEKKGLKEMVCCNRTVAKAEALGWPYLRWEERDRWVEYDLVILGTKAPHFLIDAPPPSLVKPKVLVDLSVPRNVAPIVGHHPYITLLNIDQLARQTQTSHRHLQSMVKRLESETIIEAVKRQVALFNLKELARGRLPRAS